MKRVSRMVCLLLAVVMVLAIPVAAMENENARASSFFMSSDVYLYQTSSTKFQA